jgi:hypothetical protein
MIGGGGNIEIADDTVDWWHRLANTIGTTLSNLSDLLLVSSDASKFQQIFSPQKNQTKGFSDRLKCLRPTSVHVYCWSGCAVICI